MYRKLEQFSGGSKLETWLYRLGTNEALQHLRSKKRHAVQPLVAEPSASDPNRLIESEKVQMLEIALSANRCRTSSDPVPERGTESFLP